VFSAEWLALREPADAEARSIALTEALSQALPRVDVLRVLDLASGTGANARYLLGRLRVAQEWLLTDHDSALVAAAPDRLIAWALARGLVAEREGTDLRLTRAGFGGCRLATRVADLSSLDDATLFSGRHLITASALLDLVSEAWLTALAGRCRDARASALFALTYDGRIRCEPEDPGDELVRDLVNRHQRTDKGFGPALGPAAIQAADRCFTEAGFVVRRASSDWALGSGVRELQRQLVEGWARAAREIDAGRDQAIEEWRRRRLGHIASGLSRLVVGHEDLLAVRRN
jgi:hypothetical protein